MRKSLISVGKPTDPAFWNAPSIEAYADATYYVQVEDADIAAALPAEIVAAPKQVLTTLFTGAQAVHSKYLGTIVSQYVTGPKTTPEPTVPIGVIRIHDLACCWCDIEASAGVYTWTRMDAIIAYAQSIGAEVMYTLYRTPTFYASDLSKTDQYGTVGGCTMPSDTSKWTNFVSAVATRYGDAIKYWEIWNEPNYQNGSVGCWFGSYAQMATLAQLAYTAIKAHTSSSVVICPSCFSEQANGYVSGATWLDGYLAAGGGAYADAIGYHFYLWFSRTPAYLQTYVTAIRAVMATYALSGLPLICTEVGNQETYSANGLRPMGDAEKALWMARSLIYLALAGCSRVVWYSYDGPNYVGSDGKTRRYGLIDSITKADTAQNVVWRSLAAILPGANIQRINRNNASGELHITTSAGSGRF